MITYKKIPFTFAGENYDIRILYLDHLINVVAFKNNFPASGFRHQIKIPSDIPVKDVLELDLINELVALCQADITQQRWNRLLKIRKDSQ